MRFRQHCTPSSLCSEAANRNNSNYNTWWRNTLERRNWAREWRLAICSIGNLRCRTSWSLIRSIWRFGWRKIRVLGMRLICLHRRYCMLWLLREEDMRIRSYPYSSMHRLMRERQPFSPYTVACIMKTHSTCRYLPLRVSFGLPN